MPNDNEYLGLLIVSYASLVALGVWFVHTFRASSHRGTFAPTRGRAHRRKAMVR